MADAGTVIESISVQSGALSYTGMVQSTSAAKMLNCSDTHVIIHRNPLRLRSDLTHNIFQLLNQSQSELEISILGQCRYSGYMMI